MKRTSVRAVQGGLPSLGGHGKMDWRRARMDQLTQTRGSERADDVYPTRGHVDFEKARRTRPARSNQTGKLRFGVSAKGGVMVLGLSKFPVTLYRGQWERLFAQADELRQFISANASKLSSK